ncbi:hypothetical protein Cpir12675_006530 [Ceratocystis pirilliformis]|uniref:Protein IVY1 n=1 Tax=Ceratocystis pirilliformis TaxID=259994 RepID=A0ABR3YHL8_9PEZI
MAPYSCSSTPTGPRPSTPLSASVSSSDVPSSPAYSVASTARPASQYTVPVPQAARPVQSILTKADLSQSQDAYGDLLTTAKSYRVALATLSSSASAFGAALESCARLKEARADAVNAVPASSAAAAVTKGTCTADLLLSAAGVHQLIANHQQILSETVYRSFEVPLLHELDKWRRDVEEEEAIYQRALAQQSREIRRLEKEGLKLHKQRRRHVSAFRAHLVQLTDKLDGLTALHGAHATTLLRDSQQTSATILDAACSLVRAEVDIFEGLARKGWSGGGLEDLLEKGVDLFAPDDDTFRGTLADAGGVLLGASNSSASLLSTAAAAASSSSIGTSGGDAKLFSILPPMSILAYDHERTGSGAGGPNHNHSHSHSLLDGTYSSLAGLSHSDSLAPSTGRTSPGADSFMGGAEFNRSRGVRPFSPVPIRRHEAGNTPDGLGPLAGSPMTAGAMGETEAEADVEKAHSFSGNNNNAMGENADSSFSRPASPDCSEGSSTPRNRLIQEELENHRTEGEDMSGSVSTDSAAGS